MRGPVACRLGNREKYCLTDGEHLRVINTSQHITQGGEKYRYGDMQTGF